MRKFVFLMLLAVGCDKCTGCDTDAPGERRWRTEAFPLQVQIREGLPTCQHHIVQQAAAWWESRTSRNLFVLRAVRDDAPAVHGLPPYGVIAVNDTPLAKPGSVDEVTRHSSKLDKSILHSVDMRIAKGRCDTQLGQEVRHEFGHALGLGHALRDDLLMYDLAVPSAQGLTLDELQWVTNQVSGSTR